MRRLSISLNFTVAALLMLASAAALQAQSAEITGRITDSSGGVIVNSTVQVTNLDSGTRREGRSNVEGYYSVPLLNPGKYRVTVRMDGFKPVSQGGVKLDVAQVVRLDFVLEVGDVSETVEVTAGVPLLESETSAVGQVIDSKSILEMPLNGRNPWNLVQLAGASVLIGNSGDGAIPMTTMAGSRALSQMLYVDGGIVNKGGMGRNMAELAPMVDAVQEFKVITNNYSAEYGRAAGGVFTAVTKSGTNEFHGTLFEFFRNDALDARNFFSADQPPLRYNQFGGTLGGPIVRDKTHFFFAAEATRESVGRTFILTVPTAAQRTGDFASLTDNLGRRIQLYDPFSTRPSATDPTRKIRDPYPDNIIPGAQHDPVTTKAAAFYPSPNRQGNLAGANNFQTNASQRRNFQHYTARVDHSFSQRDKIFGRYLVQFIDRPALAVFDEPAASGVGGSAARSASNLAQTALGGWSRMFSPSVLNDLKVSWIRQGRDILHPSVGGDWPSRLGLRGVGNQVFPSFRPQGFEIMGVNAAPFRVQKGPSYQVTDSLSYYKGRHGIKAGFDFRYSASRDEFDVIPSGRFDFSRQGTGLQGNNQTGDGFATMLVGFATSTQLRDAPNLRYSNQFFGAYLQDDWKVTPTLTLNLGMRYDVETPRISPDDASSGFDAQRIHPRAGVPGVVTFAGVDGEPRNAWNTDYNNFSPRFGFAWRPGGRHLVVRGGYGIFFGGQDDFGAADGPRAALGFATELNSVSPDQNQTPVLLVRQGFPPFSPPGPETRTAAFGMGGPVDFYERSRRTPYSQQSNFGLQYQLRDYLLEAQYLGNLGRKLTGPDIDVNQVRPERVGGPGSIQSRRPFSQFSAVRMLSPNWGVSSYHALLLRTEKRYQGGLQFLATYTFSKMLENVDGLTSGADIGGTPGYQDFYNRRLDKALSPNDIRHNFTFNTIWDLPLGPGRRWASDGAWSHIIGGWQLSALGTLFSGAPYGVTAQQNTCECFSAGALRPDVLRNPELPAEGRSVDRWFNTEAFAQPARFRFGNAARSVGRSPGLANFDLGIMKNFAFRERYRLQFRAEAFNAFNRANFETPNTTFGSAAFGSIRSARDARIIQLGLKLYY